MSCQREHVRGRRSGRVLAAVVGVVAVALSGCAAEPGSGRAAGGHAAGRTEEDGSIPDNNSIALSQSDHPALRRLDPTLLAAVRKAADAARAAGIELRVTSGWRSKGYQQRLLDDAVDRYGSLAEARKLVSTPETSAHVVGKAIDIGPTNAADWLIRNGEEYGLCQTYANEMWHFELLTTPGGQCPTPRGDASG